MRVATSCLDSQFVFIIVHVLDLKQTDKAVWFVELEKLSICSAIKKECSCDLYKQTAPSQVLESHS